MLLAAYQAYYILAGIAGLALYPWVARYCLQLYQDYCLSTDRAASTRRLLIGVLAIVLCSAEVQFCFSRAATLFLFATS
jgi:hypothetical protein